MKFCLYVWVNREQQRNSCPCWFYTVRKVYSVCLLQQLYTIRGAEKELLCCWFLHSQRGKQGTSSLAGHLQSGSSQSVKLIEEHSSWWKLYYDHTILFAIKEDCLLEFSSFSGLSRVNFLCSCEISFMHLFYCSSSMLMFFYIVVWKVYITGNF